MIVTGITTCVLLTPSRNSFDLLHLKLQDRRAVTRSDGQPVVMQADQTLVAYRQNHTLEMNFGKTISPMPRLDSRQVLIEPYELLKLLSRDANRCKFHELT
jgi:hypothetical protein